MSEKVTSEGRAPGLKKQPRQARSRARVEAFLDSAEQLLAERGYASLTTNAIAERTGAPVGSLYQYFDSKDDVLAEVAARFERRIETFAGETLTAELMAEDLDRFFHLLCEGLGEIQADHRSFVCVFAGGGGEDPLAALAERLRTRLAAHLMKLMEKAWPDLAEPDRRRMLTVWSQISQAMISATDRETPEGRRETIEDTALALAAYTREKFKMIGDRAPS